MTQPNDSITRQADATGVALAMHTPAGQTKRFPVTIPATPEGHLEGSEPTYLLAIPPQAVGVSKIHLDLWNGSTSNFLKLGGVWVVPQTDAAVTGTVAIRLDAFRTSAIGSGGTAASYNAATIVPNITPKDATNAALPTGVSARGGPTGGATSSVYLWSTFHHTEETHVAANLSQFFNIVPEPDRGRQDLTIGPNAGFALRQGTVAGVGNVGFLVEFSVI